MKRRIKVLLKTTLIMTVIFQLVFSYGVSARNDLLRVYSVEQSTNESVVSDSDKFMLKQDWYGMKFEVNTSDTYKGRELRAVDGVEYEKALNEVNFDLNKVGEYRVYFLENKLANYANAMALTFMDNSTVVFGTYKKLSKRDINTLAVHELGHQVDFTLMNAEKWSQYKKIRGIEDDTIYNNNSKNHCDRPQEIFAEDFRIFCGGELAKVKSHENYDLAEPEQNSELAAFFGNLTK